MKILFFITLVLVVLQSCLSAKPSNYCFSYDGTLTDLDTKIEMDGAYYDPSNFSYNLFYRDGMFIHGSASWDYFTKDVTMNRYRTSIYGMYTVIADTIIGQIINNTSANKGDVYTYKFIILSRNEIKSLSGGDTLYFKPLINRIDSVCWLLDKKWFWSKEAWKNRNK